MVDDDDPPAEGLDVGHVVARQQDRRTEPRVVLGDERPDPLLHRDVEPDRRLVEEQDLRPMEQRAGDLDLHPLAERQVANRLADEVAEVEQLDELVACLREIGLAAAGRSPGSSSNESRAGRSHWSWLRLPMTIVIRRRNAASRLRRDVTQDEGLADWSGRGARSAS